MKVRRSAAIVAAACVLILGIPAAGGDTAEDVFRNATLEAAWPLGETSSSELAFWGERAYVANGNGFRIFDIGGSSPRLLGAIRCMAPDGDVSVWDGDGDGVADLLIQSVDRPMQAAGCHHSPTAHDDPTGWEGLRVFAVEDPSNVELITTVYQDCGSHTNTVIPRPEEGRLLVLNSSFPLLPGPTCGPTRAPAAGRDPLHGVVQVVEIPLADPKQAREIAELPVTYPGDVDNMYLPISEQGLNGGTPGTTLIDGMRACFDVTVFIEAGVAAAGCGEQAQLWRLDAVTGLPDTAAPLWVYDHDHVDRWSRATFSWDGRVVVFSDESHGGGCPATTVKRVRLGEPERQHPTGNTYFVDVATGALHSEWRLPRTTQEAFVACSASAGNVIPARDRYLLAAAYGPAGTSLVDLTDPSEPTEVGYGDRSGAGTFVSYWYETHENHRRSSVTRLFSNDGSNNSPAVRNGLEQWAFTVGTFRREGMARLNPQTQEDVLRTHVRVPRREHPSLGGA